MNAYQKQLPVIISSLSTGYKPEKIILFGSMLNNDKNPNDIDLLLIKKTKTVRIGTRAEEAMRYIPFDDIAIDCLVYTPEEVKNELKRGNVFLSQILEEGKILYQA